MRLLLTVCACLVACTATRHDRPYVADARLDVRRFGAVGDGHADDTAALLRAVHELCTGRGGTLYIPPGRYRFTQTLRFVGRNCSNTTIEGDGPSSVLDFEPAGAPRDTFNDRAIYVESEVSPLQPIASAITPGDSAFTLSDAAAGQKLVPGEWLVIFERDAAAEEIVAIDWAQVSAVQGSRVDVRHPFRTRFPAARRWVDHVSGLGFHAVHSLLENVTIRNLKLVHDSDERVVPLINIGMALRTRIQDVFVDNIRGNGIALYRAKGASIHNLTVQNAPAQANEIAATVDFRISDSSFGFEASSGRSRPAADTAALNVDFGSAFFAITGNSFHAAGNIAVMFLDGVHDGVFSANTIGWVRAASIELGQGVSARGCQRLVISENSFAGGDRGKGNTCITLADSVQLQPPIESTGNIVRTNSCGGFEHETGPQRSGDRYQ